jgi:hypothetical protein
MSVFIVNVNLRTREFWRLTRFIGSYLLTSDQTLSVFNARIEEKCFSPRRFTSRPNKVRKSVKLLFIRWWVLTMKAFSREAQVWYTCRSMLISLYNTSLYAWAHDAGLIQLILRTVRHKRNPNKKEKQFIELGLKVVYSMEYNCDRATFCHSSCWCSHS